MPVTLFHPLAAENRADPYPTYARLRETAPVAWSSAPVPGFWGFWFVSRHADVSAGLKDNRFGREIARLLPPEALPPVPAHERPLMAMISHWMLFKDPPDHGRLRRLAAPVFAPRAVAGQRPAIERLAARMVDQLPAGTVVDMVGEFAYPLAIDVVSDLLGVPEGDRPLIRDWVRAITAALDVIRTEESIRIGAERAVELSAYFADLVEMHRRQPRGDLLDLLIEARDQDGRLSEEELLSACILFLFAGHEASAQLVANGLLALSEAPEAHARLRAGQVEMPLAVAELLRFTSPQQIAFRYALEDAELGGTMIRKGQTVGFGLGAANRDPRVFPDPDRLDFGREAARQLAFGAGIHSCIGAPLARIEAEATFALLARRLPRLDVAALERQDGVIVRGLARLDLRL
ncbi:cytochrome P450 [Geminicoccus roseus]|uniref:cytochrome P450 n=1 Tax=Geminicoccus roseus TaxID=404900 RepID=UPI000415EF09|nr:cytochrome P450 [Geminicoccus roseus]